MMKMQNSELSAKYAERLRLLLKHSTLQITGFNGEYSIHWKTAKAMIQRGWIEYYINFDTVRLTDSGRRAIS